MGGEGPHYALIPRSSPALRASRGTVQSDVEFDQRLVPLEIGQELTKVAKQASCADPRVEILNSY